MARLIGLIIHFTYWSVFGHFNQRSIGKYHLTLTFLTIQKILNQIISQYNTNKKFTTFFMPMIVVTIRREVDIAFYSKYPLLFKDPDANKTATNCIGLLLTKLLDPNVLYSRFSSLESNDTAISMKLRQKIFYKGLKTNDLIYTNSAIVNSLVPHKSEGKIRALFANTARCHLKSKREIEMRKTARVTPVVLQRPKTCTSLAHSLVDEKVMDTANELEMYNIALKKINANFAKRKIDPLFNTLTIN